VPAVQIKNTVAPKPLEASPGVAGKECRSEGMSLTVAQVFELSGLAKSMKEALEAFEA